MGLEVGLPVTVRVGACVEPRVSIKAAELLE
jgi:hypothetical protein